MASARKIKKQDENEAGPSGEPMSFSQAQRVLEEADVFQSQIDVATEEVAEKIIEVERRYTKKRQPLMEKRNEYLNRIPSFWATAFINHPDLNALINETEEDCIQHLSKIEVVESEDIRSGYKIHFYFEENPYFENAVLTKTFHLGTPITYINGDFSESTTIRWREGIDLTCKQVTYPNRYGRRGYKRPIQCKTFFKWFMDNVDPNSDDIAEIIKDDLWLNPLHYYLIPDMDMDLTPDLEEDEDDDGDEDADTVYIDNSDTK